MRYTAIFKNKHTGKSWVKSYTSYRNASKASKGVSRKTNNEFLGIQPSLGLEYGYELKKLNKKRKW